MTSKQSHSIPADHAKADAERLVHWYREQKRDLPWRRNRDPYRIWISEVMLQQTTVAAVIPFYERFLNRFPTLTSLADASIEDVVAYWAGLGYYSRARNLHKAARFLLAGGSFPRTYEELLRLPGFGPYTARAVASLAFGQKVGVLDGNVIRILSRRHGFDLEWWKPQCRDQLQALADQLAQSLTSSQDPSELNQGLMELGATVCTPKNPSCLLCPWRKDCSARHNERVAELPRKRPRRERETWVWRPDIIEKRGHIALIENTYAPFLRGHWICPGRVTRVALAPKRYDYRHSVTHHDIFVIVAKKMTPATTATKTGTKGKGKNAGVAADPGPGVNVKWVPRAELKKWVPTTLIRKAIETAES